MAEEAVVKENLTREMIQAGGDLIRRLDDARLEINAALWLYLPDSNLWRLVIASSAVREDGPKKVYQKIQSILSEIAGNDIAIRLKDISAVKDNDGLILLLRTDLSIKDRISGLRVSRNTINGHFIEDAYIYRMT
jgi:hypothetical protein